jgi:hypothetical protein
MLWFEMLMALSAIVALDLASGARSMAFKGRGKSHGVHGKRGERDGNTRSSRTNRA